jgi:hypothetical protein
MSRYDVKINGTHECIFNKAAAAFDTHTRLFELLFLHLGGEFLIGFL